MSTDFRMPEASASMETSICLPGSRSISISSGVSRWCPDVNRKPRFNDLTGVMHRGPIQNYVRGIIGSKEEAHRTIPARRRSNADLTKMSALINIVGDSEDLKNIAELPKSLALSG